MPIPTSYTEEELIAYMDNVLGTGVTEMLVLSPDFPQPTSYDEAFNSTMFAYGAEDVTTISGMDNIQLLRAYSRYFAWQLAANESANLHDYTHADSGATYKRSQFYDHCMKQMDKARTDIEAGGGDIAGLAVEFKTIEYSDDLYTPYPVDVNPENQWSRFSS